jgi:2-keto-4-pentenoate hydratase/2-oxohepta-3-ene-1,7-dioic acid hydratase in catechol pathway
MFKITFVDCVGIAGKENRMRRTFLTAFCANQIANSDRDVREDGMLKQDGDLEQMIWDVPGVINHLSHMVGLEAGDKIECEVEGVGTLAVKMAPMEEEYARSA